MRKRGNVDRGLKASRKDGVRVVIGKVCELLDE